MQFMDLYSVVATTAVCRVAVFCAASSGLADCILEGHLARRKKKSDPVKLPHPRRHFTPMD